CQTANFVDTDQPFVTATPENLGMTAEILNRNRQTMDAEHHVGFGDRLTVNGQFDVFDGRNPDPAVAEVVDLEGVAGAAAGNVFVFKRAGFERPGHEQMMAEYLIDDRQTFLNAFVHLISSLIEWLFIVMLLLYQDIGLPNSIWHFFMIKYIICYMQKYADIWNRFFLAIMAIGLFAGVSTQFFNATLSLHVSSSGGAASFTGVLMMVFTLAASIFRMVGGHLSDNMGRRPIILAGLAIFLGSTLASGLVAELGWLVPLRILQGIGFAASSTGMSVAVADVVRKEKIGEAIGYYGLGTALTQAVGPAIALEIMASRGFSAIAFVAAGMLGLSFLVTLFNRYEKVPQFARPKAVKVAGDNAASTEKQKKISFWVLFEKKAVPSAIVQFTVSLAFGSVMAFLTLYALQKDIDNAGLFFTLSAGSTVLSRLITGRLTDRFGPIYSLVPGIVLAILAFNALTFNHQADWLFFPAGVLFGLANGMIGPALNATAIRRSPDHRRGAASATYMVPLELALALAAVLWGAIIDCSSFEVVFGCGVGILFVSLILAIIFFGRKNQDI
ncbi:MAG TPA: hypothetical protein DCM45_00025, partial [Clostridiales bacterium]|nr:hypothetical protein [Clostridiales bacterium]